MSSPENEEDLLDIKEDLIAILDDVRSTGSFVTSANLHTAVNPGLYIPSVGNIRLPISVEDAKAIIQASHLSPYGKGTETLINESVRKSWQLNADQLALQNPLWQAQIGMLVNKAVTGLGLKANSQEVKAELYKLLIYEEGAFFLPHQDSEKADGMFGTLTVCLPSKHEGGDVIASHQDDHITFKTASTSEFGFSWAAWYADVTHEVKPVTSGYRIVLIYNLIHRPSAALLDFHGSKTEKLVRLLESWARAADEDPMQYLDGWDEGIRDACPPALVYKLEHQYTMAELSFSRLKGVDQSRFAELQDACRRTGFNIFLANIEKIDIGGVDDDGYYDGYYGGYYDRDDYAGNGTYPIRDLIDSSLELSHVVNSEGITVGRHIPFREDMLVQEGVFDRDPDNEDFQGFTGNEGATTTHFYHETGALIIPERFRFLFACQQLKRGQGDAKQFLEECHRVVSERPDDMLAKQKLLQVCRVILASSRHSDIEHDKVMQIALELADLQLFRRIMESLGGKFSPSQIAKIAKIISQHGLASIRTSLDKLFGNERYGPQKLLFRHMKLLSDLVKDFHSICGQQDQKALSEVFQWQDITFDRILSTELGGSESDGHDLAKVLNDCPIPGTLGRVMAFLEKKSENTALIVSFITSAHDYSHTGNLDKGEVDAMFKRLFPEIVRSFKVERGTRLRPGETYAWISYCHPPEKTSRISPELVVKLIQSADATDNDITGIMNTLTEYTLNVKGSEMESAFHEFLLPVVNGLCGHIKATKRSSTTGERRFIKQVLTKYVTDYVQSAPSPPPDWRERTSIRCHSPDCRDCPSLRRFINDSSKKTEDFPIAERRRKHLDQQLDKSWFYTTTIKVRSPYTLRVVKTKAMLVSNYQAWTIRAGNAQAKLQPLLQMGIMEEILGDAYDSIFAHQNLAISNTSQAVLSHWNARNTVQSTVPAKRPFER
ncbi:hypothetical protein BDV23DRAFT_179916 [Aspergillus alliaceus]|uniref:Uncharacterized protein n=1 Tax=Petromyces alliaceus TaxID=209559 RepID=A0A5N7CIT0_PETAA|nr:hypothetical protein BDV23DRAFT_179916 [Aspergillus alliaceus]